MATSKFQNNNNNKKNFMFAVEFAILNVRRKRERFF